MFSNFTDILQYIHSTSPGFDGSDSFLWSRWLYLRILGVGYITAFLSLMTQIRGLIGPQGILPAYQLLAEIENDTPGWRKYFLAPSIFRLSSSSWALLTVCWIGFLAGLLVFLNISPAVNLLLCWACYLSFVSVAQDFSGFQSDGLMLESTILALLVAPYEIWPELGAHSPPTLLGVFMCRWLTFRLMTESGLALTLLKKPANFSTQNLP